MIIPISFGLFFDENDIVRLIIDYVIYEGIAAACGQLLLKWIKIVIIFPLFLPIFATHWTSRKQGFSIFEHVLSRLSNVMNIMNKFVSTLNVDERKRNPAGYVFCEIIRHLLEISSLQHCWTGTFVFRRFLVDHSRVIIQFFSFDRLNNCAAANLKLKGFVLDEKSSFKKLGLPFSLKWTPPCYLDRLNKLQEQVCRTVGPAFAVWFDPLAYRWNLVSLNLFYRYYFGRCLSDLAELVPFLYSCGRSAPYSNRLHEFSDTIPRCYIYGYVNGFFLWLDYGILCL